MVSFTKSVIQRPMTKLPSSFDPYLMKDELLAALRQSPLTAQLVSLRAEEIIQVVIEKPIVMTLEEQIRMLRQKLEEERHSRKTLRSDSKKHNREHERDANQKDLLIHTLKQQLQAQTHSIQAQELQNQQLEEAVADYQARIEQLQSQLQESQNEHRELRATIDQKTNTVARLQHAILEKSTAITLLTEQQQKRELQYKRSEQVFSSQLARMKQERQREKKSHQQQVRLAVGSHKLELQQKDSLMQSLKEERFDLKNQINSLKIDLQQATQLAEHLTDQNNQLLLQKDKLKQTIKLNKLIFDKERKMVNQRLHDLSLTHKHHQKLKIHLTTTHKTLSKLHTQYQQFRDWAKQQLRILALQAQHNTKQLLDEVGKHVETELKSLSQKLQAKNEETREARSEAKMREQVLQRSEKQVASYNKEISDLKSELRQKKREEERLRRELKANYEEYQAKLSKMEKKYLELLDKGSF